MSYDKDIARMEEITNRLQDTSIPLEESIALFEEGVKIARKVEKELSEIERKIELLVTPPEDSTESPKMETFPSNT